MRITVDCDDIDHAIEILEVAKKDKDLDVEIEDGINSGIHTAFLTWFGEIEVN